MTRPSPRFLSQLAHDLRSPLNVIGSTLTELSQDAALSTGEREQILTLSQKAVGRLLSLSDRLALAARLGLPFELKVGPVDLASVTREAIARFIPAQLRRGIEVVSALPEVPLQVDGDGVLLTALFFELLTNANRFARRKLRVELAAGTKVTLTVDDDGDGVPEDERARLFEPFAERRSRTGLGMGLWLARQLAELHQGTLTVESLPVGTRQQLTLPLGAP